MMTSGVGKTDLRDVSADDLFAIDEESAKIANIPLHYQSVSEVRGKKPSSTR